MILTEGMGFTDCISKLLSIPTHRKVDRLECIQNVYLSDPLYYLFSLNGAALSFPMLADMSIINDRLAMPLNILPVYSAISFLPWSLKPLYAWIESGMQVKRHFLIALLLISGSSLTLLATATPSGKHGIIYFIILSFVRSIVTAFPEFLLGLVLLDEARFASCETNQMVLERTTIEQMSTGYPNENEYSNREREYANITYDNDDDDECLENENVCLENEQCSRETQDSGRTSDYRTKYAFHEICGMFQAQAATARNFGSLFSSLSFFVFLIIRNVDDSDGPFNEKLRRSDVTYIYIITSCFPVIGGIISIYCKVGLSTTSTSGVDCKLNLREVDNEIYCEGSVFEIGKCDDDKIEVESFFDCTDTEIPQDRDGKKKRDETIMPSKPKVFSVWDILMLGCFQLLLVFVVFKDSLSKEHKRFWWSFVIVFLLFMVYCMYKATRANQSVIEKKVALFLVLKNSVPSLSGQISSYAYFLFQNNPFFLQLLSVGSSLLTTVGSRVYGKYVVPRFQNIVPIFIVAIVVYSVVTLFYLFPLSFPSSSSDIPLELYIVFFSIYAMYAFISEIEFLPSIALATSSASSVTQEDEDERIDGDRHVEEVEENDSFVEDSYGEDDKVVAFRYGTYVSCVDFGDQISLWIETPIVSALGMNRGNWSSLKTYIWIVAAMNMFSLLLLPILCSTKQYNVIRRDNT